MKNGMIRIPMPHDILGKMKEGAVLNLVAQEIEMNRPTVNGKDVIAGWLQEAGIDGSKTHVRNAIEGRTHIGYVAWLVVVKRSGTTLRDEWCAATEKLMQVPEAL